MIEGDRDVEREQGWGSQRKDGWEQVWLKPTGLI
jgi:hypothetical protein